MSEQDKPLRDWTLGEVQVECRLCECNENCKLWDTKKIRCRLTYSADGWDLIDPPRFTSDEVAMMRLLRVGGVETLTYAADGILSWQAGRASGLLPHKLFPSIRAWQSVALAEVINGNTKE